VKKFDDGGKFDGAPSIGVSPGGVTVAKQQQSGTNPLASAAEKVTGNFGNGLEGSGALA
jgi:hypothetical protein